MVSKMVRPKKEWVCTKCHNKYIRWEGVCRTCKGVNTLQEIILRVTREKPQETIDQRRLRRRAKDSERGIAKRMVSVDGADPAFSKIASSTGRIGHISGIRVDAVSRTYVTENKNRKMPTWLVAAWILINQRAIDFNKNALLHVEPPNMPKTFPIQGRTEKLDTMAIITQTRHEQLIRKEKALGELESILFSEVKLDAKLQQAQNVFNYDELDKDA